MRVIYYTNKSPNGDENKHFINIDRIDHITFSESAGEKGTRMYCVSGDNVHLVSSEKRVEKVSTLLSMIFNLSDRTSTGIDTLVEEANKIALKKSTGRMA